MLCNTLYIVINNCIVNIFIILFQNHWTLQPIKAMHCVMLTAYRTFWRVYVYFTDISVTVRKLMLKVQWAFPLNFVIEASVESYHCCCHTLSISFLMCFMFTSASDGVNVWLCALGAFAWECNINGHRRLIGLSRVCLRNALVLRRGLIKIFTHIQQSNTQTLS